MDRPKKRASPKSFKLIIPAVIILLVVLALAGQAAVASIGNQSPNGLILPDVYFSDPVPNVNPNRPNESCIVGIFGGPDDIALEHEWWLYYRGTGTQTVDLNVWAASVNPSEAGEIVVDFVDDSGAQSLTVVHPSGGENMGTLSLTVTGGQRYSFTVSKNAAAGVAHHYRLGTDDRATELGWGGVFDWLYYMESGRNDWAFHAVPQPQEANAVEISIMVDGSGTGEVPTQAQNITYAVVDAATMNDVIPETTQAIGPGSSITIAFPVSAAKATFILKIDGDGHYRMQNQSGTDWGFYLLPCPEQEGHDDDNPRLVLVDPDDPHTDIGQLPIILENVGDEAIIDFRIEPGTGLDNIYAGEFHFVVEGPLEILDSRPDLPGINLETQGEGLAANGLEELNLSTVGSPDERDNNIDTAQIYIPVNDVYWDDDVQFGDFTFTLLGDPRPGEPFHRTEAFMPDEWGGISLARMHVRAIDSGIANMFLINPEGETIPVLMIAVDQHGDLVDDPPAVDFRHPAGIVEIDLVQIRVNLQGTRDQDYQWQVPLGIEIFEPSEGGGFPDEPLVDFFFCEQTRRDGPWAVCSIEDTPDGFFDVFVSSARTLVNVKRNVELKGMVDFQNPLREGDLNENGVVNAMDFSMWLETWRDEVTPCPPEHFDGFSIGDFDKDCFVGATDFSIFLENWRHESPQEEPQ